ncbi:unnamed protein product [Urochloa humidicola]
MSNQRGSRFDDDTRSVAARQNLDMRSLQQDNDSLQQKLRILEEVRLLEESRKKYKDQVGELTGHVGELTGRVGRRDKEIVRLKGKVKEMESRRCPRVLELEEGQVINCTYASDAEGCATNSAVK